MHASHFLARMCIAIPVVICCLLPRVAIAAAQASPPASSQVVADSAVRDTLQRYSAALERLDPDAVKKVQPAIPVATLAKAFKDMRELKVVIDDIKVLSSDAMTVRVSCRVTQTLTPRAGAKQTTTVVRVVRLRRDISPGGDRTGAHTPLVDGDRDSRDNWVIDAFER